MAKVTRPNLPIVRPKTKDESAPVTSSAGFDGVLFASSAAEMDAVEAGLDPADFEGQEPTGATGFTVADVRRIADEQ